MPEQKLDFQQIYTHFSAPITDLDCGALCAVHNPHRIPFCCDICYAVPAAYNQEWVFLKQQTDLWHPWRGDECPDEPIDPDLLQKDTPAHMRLLACKGPQACQRSFRSISCRQFPFFPYITSDDRFIGLAYHWDFEPWCWVISHLEQVTPTFRHEFIETYDRLLMDCPEDYDSYYYLTEDMRTEFARRRRRIPILHRNGHNYLLSPKTEKLQKAAAEKFRKFGPYRDLNKNTPA